MFPDKFHRQLENMDSLFVNDFYEVNSILNIKSEKSNSNSHCHITKGDKNITHRLESELKAADWQLLILHYLGLDHIGHVEGPRSSKIHSKLQEMDNVIQRIHLEMLEWVRFKGLGVTSDSTRDGLCIFFVEKTIEASVTVSDYR